MVRIPVSVADGIWGNPCKASSSQRRWAFLRFMALMVLEYQGFLPPDLRAREASEPTKTERKAVRDIIATATQASICCQTKSQTLSNVPRKLRPDTRTQAVIAMNRFKERKRPSINF